MIGAFVMLFAGGMLLGGSWSFYRAGKPWWSIAGLALAGLVCFAVSVWRIRTG